MGSNYDFTVPREVIKKRIIDDKRSVYVHVAHPFKDGRILRFIFIPKRLDMTTLWFMQPDERKVWDILGEGMPMHKNDYWGPTRIPLEDLLLWTPLSKYLEVEELIDENKNGR